MCKSKAASWLCMGLGLLFLARGESGLAEQEKVQTTTRPVPACAKFQNTAMGEMRDEDGVHLGFTFFKGSNGSRLTVLYEDFRDSGIAQNYFEKQIAKAAKVIKREKKLDTSGNSVGDKAEILLRNGEGMAIPTILRTDGSQFHEFYSASRQSLLQLEKCYMGDK